MKNILWFGSFWSVRKLPSVRCCEGIGTFSTLNPWANAAYLNAKMTRLNNMQ